MTVVQKAYGGDFLRMSSKANYLDGYVKASAYVVARRKYVAVSIVAAILFACFICVVILRNKPVEADTPAISAHTEADGDVRSDAETVLSDFTLSETAPSETALDETETTLSDSAQEDTDLTVQIIALATELERREREYFGTQLFTEALRLGQSSVLLNLEDLTQMSGAAEYQLNDLLQQSPMAGLGWEFLKAEREYGINAIALVILTALETGTVEPGTAEPGAGVQYTLYSREGESGPLMFDTYEACIDYFARMLGEEYLSPGGRYFSGTSFEDVYTGFAEDSERVNAAALEALEYANRLNTTRG